MGLIVAAALVAAWVCTLAAGLAVGVELDGAASVSAAAGWIALRTLCCVGLFITAHDAMHGVVRPGAPRVNAAVGRLCLALFACMSFPKLRAAHMRHHAGPARDSDPDWCPDQRLAPWFASFVGRYVDRRLVARNATVVVALLLIGVSPVEVVVLLVAPAWLATVQLFVFGTWLPHRLSEGQGFVDDHRARSLRTAPLASFMSCFHFGGYHWEHHARPSAPWWGLPAVRLSPSRRAR